MSLHQVYRAQKLVSCWFNSRSVEAAALRWASSFPSAGLASPTGGKGDSEPEHLSFSNLPLSSDNSARLWSAEWVKSDTSRTGRGPQKGPKTAVSVEMLPKELL